MGDEADALSNIGDELQADEEFLYYQQEEKEKRSIKKDNRLIDAERAEVGTTIRCPECSRLIVKKNEKRLFCDNDCASFFGAKKEPVHSIKIQSPKSRYKRNKEASIGDLIYCAWCGKEMLKRSYHHQFCRNKGKNNCKDAFWNTVVEKRRNRAKYFNKSKY